MIKLQCIGHIGKDATVNVVNGKNVINFSVAHTEKFTQNGEKKEKTTWVDAAYWTDKAAIAPYLKKGTQVYIEGQPEIRTWENNGKSGASLTVRVMSVQLLGGGQQQAQQPAASSVPQGSYIQPTDQQQIDAVQLDDLPF